MTRHVTEEMHRVHVGSLLASLIAKLETGPGPEVLGPLIRDCDAALLASLEALRDRADEPDPPVKSELAVLLESLMTSNRRDTIGVLRQIRRAIGRLDGTLG